MWFNSLKLRAVNTNLKTIRKRLGLTQQQVGDIIGRTKSMVSQYEGGLDLPVDAARKLIAEAALRGEVLTFDDFYVLPERERAAA